MATESTPTLGGPPAPLKTMATLFLGYILTHSGTLRSLEKPPEPSLTEPTRSPLMYRSSATSGSLTEAGTTPRRDTLTRRGTAPTKLRIPRSTPQEEDQLLEMGS